jgi:hypothetical protein
MPQFRPLHRRPPNYITSIQKILAPSSDKCAILNNGTSTCIKDYGFPFAGTTAYNPLSLPDGEPGTEALSNAAGNAFTLFPSPTMTLTLFPAYTSTITAAPFEKSAGADGVVVQGSSIVGGGVATTAAGVGATGTGRELGLGLGVRLLQRRKRILGLKWKGSCCSYRLRWQWSFFNCKEVVIY